MPQAAEPNPRFVVLRHLPAAGSGEPPHWDLLLDLPPFAGDVSSAGQRLATWSLAAPPELAAPSAARRLVDHRRVFLVYEGPLTGNRGTVVRYDAGPFRLLRLAPGEVVISCSGGKLRGMVLLVAGPAADAPWQFTRRGDERPVAG